MLNRQQFEQVINKIPCSDDYKDGLRQGFLTVCDIIALDLKTSEEELLMDIKAFILLSKEYE